MSTSRSSAQPVGFVKTRRFSVLETTTVLGKLSKTDLPSDIDENDMQVVAPFMELKDLLLHKQLDKTEEVQTKLLHLLTRHGYVFLNYSSMSTPGKIVCPWKSSLESDFFPLAPETTQAKEIQTKNEDENNSNKDCGRTFNKGKVGTSDIIYISEKGIPMWKIGYELCDKDVREAFRVHAGRPDDQPWPNKNNAREIWLRGLALCRHICDQALELTLRALRDSKDTTTALESAPILRKRPGSGSNSWLRQSYCTTARGELRERTGDYSVLYAMHYFNDEIVTSSSNSAELKNMKLDTDASANDSNIEKVDNDANDDCKNNFINVKEHVDPSLFVLEPYITTDCKGLQIWDLHTKTWIDCDGPNSKAIKRKTQTPHCKSNNAADDEGVMVLFVGRAFSALCRNSNDDSLSCTNGNINGTSSCKKNIAIQPTLHRVVRDTQRRTAIIYEQKYEEYFPPPILD